MTARTLAPLWMILVALTTGCTTTNPHAIDDAGLVDAGADLPVARDAQRSSDLSHGPYPLVLVHGFFGFEQLARIDYFYGVRQALQADGHRVFVPEIDPINTTAVRGPQLLAAIERILSESGAEKLNLIGHSQGGIDARYVAQRIPQRIASVTTIGSPHLGSAVADAALGRVPSIALSLLQALSRGLGTIFGPVEPSDLRAFLQSISSENMARFNSQHPAIATIAYYSLAGRSAMAPNAGRCQVNAPAFVSRYDDDLDPVATPLYVSSRIAPQPNDGLVEVEITRWGRFLGCVPADHWDQIGQLFGDSPGGDNGFDHVAFYRGLANWLVAQGH